MRARVIHPGFWQDEKLARCEPLARLTFIGLLTFADDEGRLRAHPCLLKAALFPYDPEITPEGIERWLSQLEDQGIIIRYTHHGEHYCFIKNFRRYQKLRRPRRSTLPPPPPGIADRGEEEEGETWDPGKW